MRPESEWKYHYVRLSTEERTVINALRKNRYPTLTVRERAIEAFEQSERARLVHLKYTKTLRYKVLQLFVNTKELAIKAYRYFSKITAFNFIQRGIK